MRIISGGTKLIPLRELYKETGLSKLKDRRENHQLISGGREFHNFKVDGRK
jgi:hypothetical protein